MIQASFKLFESTVLGLTPEQKDTLKDGISLNVFKGRKRDDNKTVNYKNISVRSLDFYMNNVSVNGDETTNTSKISVTTNKNTKVVGELKNVSKNGEVTDNSIQVTVNGEEMYHMDGENYGTDELIQHMIKYHKKYMQTEWKTR